MKNKVLVLLALFGWLRVNGQQEHYTYFRLLKTDTIGWGELVIPDEVFSKATCDLSDLRIKGITSTQDTIEAAYLLQIASDQVSTVSFPIKTLNKVRNTNGFSYSFEMPFDTVINELQLNFNNKNFDFKIILEGSADFKLWENIVSDYRLVAFSDGEEQFNFSKIKFGDVRFRYLRLTCQTNNDPNFTTATILYNKIVYGDHRGVAPIATEIKKTENNKNTVTNFTLKNTLPYSGVQFEINQQFDYYRPFTLEALTAVIKNETGETERYTTVLSGMLSSFDEKKFSFDNICCKKFRLTIFNGNNPPLTVRSSAFSYNAHKLKIRFIEKAEYALYYGNPNVEKPQYDLINFQQKFPQKFPVITAGDEQLTPTLKNTSPFSIFNNKAIMWVFILIIIALMGGFTLKMMKKN